MFFSKEFMIFFSISSKDKNLGRENDKHLHFFKKNSSSSYTGKIFLLDPFVSLVKCKVILVCGYSEIT